ncbi:MAG: putative peroxiredoxin [Geminicoccaceae bacterium]|nr:putative peroxiredoxin [Geminicoccaceae bacterium]
MRCTSAASRRLAVVALGALMLPLASAAAQQPAAPAPAETGPKVGDIAPDFTLPGATRYGLLRDPVTLSGLRGKTVVLAFFIKARTRG